MFRFAQTVLTLMTFVFLALSGFAQKNSPYQEVTAAFKAKPELLAFHRDSVRFVLEGAVPIKFLQKDVKISIAPEYVYKGGRLGLGEKVIFDGVYDAGISDLKFSMPFVMPYREGMQVGELQVGAIVHKGKRVFKVPAKLVAQGVDTTPLLARMGQIVPDEPIPVIGIMLQEGEARVEAPEIREFEVFFSLGSDRLLEWPVALERFLLSGVEGKAVTKAQVIGLVSGENQELANPSLGDLRASQVKNRLRNYKLLQKVQIEDLSRSKSWFDFRIAFGNYSGLSDKEKESFYEVLTSGKDYETQLRELRALPGYTKVSRDLFPKLRSAKVVITLEKSQEKGGNPNAVYQAISQGLSLDGFSQEQLQLAANQARSLDQKQQIYAKLAEKYASDIVFNNYGVVLINQAQRELGEAYRRELIQRAVTALRQAVRMKPRSEIFHNLGRALILKGDYFDAYVAISEASAMERNETGEFLRFNEGLRGALDIVNGDYKLATIRLNRAPETEENLFNKGLAHFLSKEYKAAIEAFEDCVQRNREYGYGFYGLALLAALTEDRQALYENLSKAVEKSEYLRERAMEELIFRKFMDEKEFQAIVLFP